MKPIKLDFDFTEGTHYFQETHGITLDNGDDVSFNITADITVSENIGANFYEENQTTVKVENLEVSINGIWNDDGKVDYTPTEYKELKKLILENIE